MSAPRTMSETLERARDRAALIARQDADSIRLTERLDAEALRVLVEGFDAERAAYATLEQEYESAKERVRLLERALYPLVVEALRAECCDDAPEYVNNEPYEGMKALPECAPCAGTGATDHKHYEDVPIPDEVRCEACDGWGFLMHAATTPRAQAVKEVE